MTYKTANTFTHVQTTPEANWVIPHNLSNSFPIVTTWIEGEGGVVTTLLPSTGGGDEPTLLHIIDNPNAFGSSAGDEFGYSTSISGNYAIVASVEDDSYNRLKSGKVYLFDVTTGALLRTLDNPNGFGTSSDDNFGWTLSISGDYAIVGAYKEDESGSTTSGKAYIFDVTTGALLHTIDNPNIYGTPANDRFGYSTSISGNYAIVGTTGEYQGGGVVYVFDVTTGTLLRTLDNPNAFDTSYGDRFGYSTAISGNYAIVTANAEDDAGGLDSGKVYIFDVTTGTLLHTLDNPNAYGTSASDYFGTSLAISDTHAIVGAHNEDDASGPASGNVYIFDVATGALLHTLDDPNAYGTGHGDYFGVSVSISGNYVIVGAHIEDEEPTRTDTGIAYIFDVTTGALLHTIGNPNAYGTSANDRFGISVSISGNYVIVGAESEDDASGSASGKAYIFELSGPDGAVEVNTPNTATISFNAPTIGTVNIS